MGKFGLSAELEHLEHFSFKGKSTKPNVFQKKFTLLCSGFIFLNTLKKTLLYDCEP